MMRCAGLLSEKVLFAVADVPDFCNEASANEEIIT